MTTKFLLLCTVLTCVWGFGSAAKVNISEYPYHVSLQRSGKHVCSGALIHESWIITAASCVYNANASEFKIRVRTSSLFLGGDDMQVEKILIHNEFDKYVYSNNIALLKLTIPAEYGEKLLPIAIAEEASEESETKYYVTGWKRYMNGSVECELSVIAVEIVSGATCAELMPNYMPVSEKMVCAGNITNSVETCQGDPGAPLAVDETLIGILSYGLGCETMLHPGVYTRISSYGQWISSNSGIRYNNRKAPTRLFQTLLNNE